MTCAAARQSGMLSTSSRCGLRVVLGGMVSTPEVKNIVQCDVDSEEHNQPAVKNLVERREHVDLAATGVAFDCLGSMDKILALLLEVRIYSRMTPGGNVQCVKLHIETVAATYTCGDGGNDGGSDFRARRCGSD
ncbi:HAD-like domain [Phytophthora cactorum]|nr:HAD-like domain [Phytophthora cactorum]